VSTLYALNANLLLHRDSQRPIVACNLLLAYPQQHHRAFVLRQIGNSLRRFYLLCAIAKYSALHIGGGILRYWYQSQLAHVIKILRQRTKFLNKLLAAGVIPK
jgi:hypothetical protein